jgi:hypothetical protein
LTRQTNCDSFFRGSKLKLATCERAVLPRGGRVLIRSQEFINPLPTGGGFFVLTRLQDGNN